MRLEWQIETCNYHIEKGAGTVKTLIAQALRLIVFALKPDATIYRLYDLEKVI